MRGAMKKTRTGGIDLSKKYVCMECGCQRDPIQAKRGFLFVELFMWLLYIVPGVIYSIWRRLRTHQICPNCRNPSIVLTSSSRAMGMMRLLRAFSPSTSPISTRPSPSSSQKQVAPSKSKPEEKNFKQVLNTSHRRGLKPKGQQGLVNFKPGNDGNKPSDK